MQRWFHDFYLWLAEHSTLGVQEIPIYVNSLIYAVDDEMILDYRPTFY